MREPAMDCSALKDGHSRSYQTLVMPAGNFWKLQKDWQPLHPMALTSYRRMDIPGSCQPLVHFVCMTMEASYIQEKMMLYI